MSNNRVTTNALENKILSNIFFNLGEAVAALRGIPAEQVSENLRRITICALEMENGYVAIGTSAAADLANFDVDRGRGAARESAVNSIWPLLGYELRTKLTAEKTNEQAAPDGVCTDADGCPTEMAVLKREWRAMRQQLNQQAIVPTTQTKQVHVAGSGHFGGSTVLLSQHSLRPLTEADLDRACSSMGVSHVLITPDELLSSGAASNYHCERSTTLIEVGDPDEPPAPSALESLRTVFEDEPREDTSSDTSADNSNDDTSGNNE